jgi:hypothetical protein
MIDVILWIAGGLFLLLGALLCFLSWLRMLDDDSKMRRDLKHRCNHKWQGGHGNGGHA